MGKPAARAVYIHGSFWLRLQRHTHWFVQDLINSFSVLLAMFHRF